ncbi:MAG: glycolate oxidase iron-sulfur subunit [Betaproteobacteria bacterium RIFCSPLOWO2_02_FULL_65_24]|nr:MAG: glycolate oxidase iron-sulfur subunit [Betaproteobacteria bacterium RIFCSPLOWO2_02_FULL_65_24]
MQTKLADFIKDTADGREADAILRKCVHCGFCTATCPTYQLLGDELDGPRGRIYLIKGMLEGAAVTARTQLHLDRCLTCRACETTCPSGVQYGRLVDIGRKLAEERVPRALVPRLLRLALRTVLPRSWLFASLLRLGRWMRPVLPFALQGKIPASVPEAGAWPAARHARRMLVLAGCVQPALGPDINVACARVLDKVGISLIEAPGAGCCGAVRFHLNAQEDGLSDMRALIDTWWPYVEAADAGAAEGVEAIVMTASGCGTTVKEYCHLLAHDPRYAAKAKRISALAKDISEVIAAELDRLKPLFATTKANTRTSKLALQLPCSLQHGQKITGVVESILAAAGFELTPIADSHLCCGSAGTYSILQPELSAKLKANKLAALHAGSPQAIVSANLGCMSHLQSGTALPLEHWIVALERRLAG